MIFFFMVLVWFLFLVMNGSISPTSADLSKVVNLATLHTLLPNGWALSGWMAGNTITAPLLHRHFGMYFSDCVSVILLLSVSCQTPLFCLDWLILQTGFFGLPLYICQSMSAHPFFCVFIHLSAQFAEL